MHDEGSMADSAEELKERIDRMFERMDRMQENLELLVRESEERGPATTYPDIIPGARIQPSTSGRDQGFRFAYNTVCKDTYPTQAYNTTHPCVRDDCHAPCSFMAKAACSCMINGVFRTFATREGSPGHPGSCGYAQMDYDRSYVPTLCLAANASEGFKLYTATPTLCANCEAWGHHRETPAASAWAHDESPNVGTWGDKGISGPKYYEAADGKSGSFTPPR